MRNTMSIHCVWFCKGISTTNELLREREAVWLCSIDTNLHWIDHFDRYSMIKSNESWCKIRERERTNERAQTSIYFMNYLIICSVALGIPCFLYTFYGRGAPALARFESIVRSFHMALWFWSLFFFVFILLYANCVCIFFRVCCCYSVLLVMTAVGICLNKMQTFCLASKNGTIRRQCAENLYEGNKQRKKSRGQNRD